MEPIRTPNYTRGSVGESQGYTPVFIRDTVIIDNATGQPQPFMVVHFRPSIEEVRDMTRGKPVILTIMGTQFAPMLLTVGKAPDEA